MLVVHCSPCWFVGWLLGVHHHHRHHTCLHLSKTKNPVALDCAAHPHPCRPSDNLGPLLFDLPQQQLQQLLLRSNRPQLDAAISSSASIWQQLTAAAAAGHSAQWQQQLQDVRWLLPRALRTAGWLPNSSGVQFSGRAKSSSSRDWVSEVMASQTTSGDEATAAARRVFWQQLQQQPGLLSGLLDRLRFLRQLGPQAAKTAAQQAAPSAAAGDSANQPQQHQKQQPHQQVQANTQVRPGQLWDVLAASDAAFSAQFPPFCAWQRLARLVEDRPAWQQELSEMTGRLCVSVRERERVSMSVFWGAHTRN